MGSPWFGEDVSWEGERALPVRADVLVYSYPRAEREAPSATGEPQLTVWQQITDLVPGVQFVLAANDEEYRELLDSQDFHAVVFDWPPAALAQQMLLPELKLRNETPGVLVLGDADDPVTIATLYNAGCHRFIPKLEGWRAELAQALRGVLRAKRAESAHERARARLTEMLGMLEEKNNRLEEFSVTLAHDVRGPLAGISMKLDYILESFGGQLPERAQSFMSKALESTRRLTDLVQAMYEYARVGAKYREFERVDLAELVRDASSDLQVDDRLDVKLGIGDLPHVWGSRNLLRRVFLNLIQNAIKYSDKPEVIVNINCERIEERALARFALVVVSDNGPGVDEASKSSLFSLFARGNSKGGKPGERNAPDGLGAGLAVVQRIIELHFGRILVENAPEGGARFLLSLPLEPVEVG